ncbi:Zn-dependent hydrolase [Congregibacter litoralis]|uniref:Amidase, hydantoinase/carbamoylase family n=1 Tax=Congregibacter litoralis KT71 TaxID=314285 RepID=A4A7B6_9GAMM|nr:Zn-dependent hydrolase [Congregibacter litoralis]EAQ98185.2 amidase, hydantoinase/carbamoylase family [Congregibacter litoralis KT71]
MRLFVGFVALMLSQSLAFAQPLLTATAERMQSRIEALAAFGANPEGGVSRVAFTDADLAAREWLKAELRELGLSVRTDTAGNIIGRREGSQPGFPPIMFGSHIDSVPGGGNYDGQVGVVGALEVISVLNDADITTRHPLEFVSFTDEEGGLVGSRAMVGKLTQAGMDVVSNSGLVTRDGIARVGGDPERIAEAARSPESLRAFFELHIEQGGILEQKNLQIGVVEGIVGIQWWDITVSGVANHGGTTPMPQRVDALVSASELTLAINRIALELEGRQVATVGRIEAFPGAPNVVPGKVVMSLEVRDLSENKIWEVFRLIEAEAARIATARGTTISFTELDTASPPAPTDTETRDIIEAAAKRLGYSYQRMPSGAGHDAQDLAQITPTGMIFVPSKGGISHSPFEYTSPEDMARGASVLLQAILATDDQS